ncbi:hypothetical protein KY495_10660 [Massilia sp. PAMC28688]|uniref:hypothetical protein n=1 Tax=Massilia sp. PAMC28688 TaxID=2861283 RepID=UPI001C62764F|nr:hypothetical protein [Massilia sp. PAMC28688]QYF95562.1 hypothetical protein KY495_10660 [Massilia sp. PAMC28688]
MKTTICVTAALTAASVFAQPPVMPGPAKGSNDRVLVLQTDQMPVPPPADELRKMQSMLAMKAEDGFSRLIREPQPVREFMNDLNIVRNHQSGATKAAAFAHALKTGKSLPVAPVVVKDLNDLKIGFSPTTVRSGRLIGVAPQGTMVRGAWTGVERYYAIDGAGTMRVSETDLAASGGMFYMHAPLVNARIGGKPAISVVFADDHGQRIEEVMWGNGPKLFKVTFAPLMRREKNGQMKANVAVSAFSLASDLR